MSSLWHGVLLLAVLWSALQPADRLTWWLEIAPALGIYVVLLATRSAVPLTALSYWLLLWLMIIMLVGGHYGFDAVPLFDGSSRNNFDKFAHFFQGFVPAVAFREGIIRLGVVALPAWRGWIAATAALALSAAYELVEWSAHLLLGDRAETFIGAQGDPWDAQSDMAMALFGAVVAMVSLSRLQDRLLERSSGRRAGG